MRMRIGVGLVALVTGVAIAIGGPAQADPSPDAIYQSLGVNNVPADYVVLVDVSGSMQSSQLYGPVKASLRALFAALAPQDEVTMIAFAGTATQVWQGTIGQSPEAPIAKLPARADGGNTDIGLALAMSLKVLNRPSAPPIASVIMLTDGRHDPAPTSPYPLTSGYGWDQLHIAAMNMHKASLSAYAVPLSGDTSANLLTKVYGRYASVLKTDSVDHLTQQLNAPEKAVLAAKARSLIAPDLRQGVVVSWPDSSRTLTAGTSALTVQLRSTTSHLPLTVSNLQVSACPQVRAQIAGTGIALAPGQTVTVPVRLSWDGGPTSWQPLHTARQVCHLDVTAAVGSPWTSFVTGTLRLPPPGAGLTAATATASFSVQRGTWPGWVTAWVILLMLCAALLAVRWSRSHPVLTGVLTTTVEAGGKPRSLALHGRRMTISAQTAGIPGAGVLSGTRTRGTSGPTVLEIAYSRDGSASGRDVRACAVGESVTVKGIRFEWQRDGA